MGKIIREKCAESLGLLSGCEITNSNIRLVHKYLLVVNNFLHPTNLRFYCPFIELEHDSCAARDFSTWENLRNSKYALWSDALLFEGYGAGRNGVLSKNSAEFYAVPSKNGAERILFVSERLYRTLLRCLARWINSKHNSDSARDAKADKRCPPRESEDPFNIQILRQNDGRAVSKKYS